MSLNHFWTIACLWTLGCAEMDMMMAGEAGYDADTAANFDESDSINAQTLRLDIRPGGDLDLEPQSFPLTDEDVAADLLVELSPSISMNGIVTGFDATPYASPTVPGNDEIPVQSRIHARIPGTIANNSTTSQAEDGVYELTIPAGSGYQLAVVPIDPAALPFGVWTDETLKDSQQADFALGYGFPVYGVVQQTNDVRLPSAGQLYLVDPATGFEGARTETGANGHYMLRAYPGEYTLVFEGDEASYLPRIETTVVVEDEYGARQDIDVGMVSPVEVSGRVLGADGNGVKDAIVRFTSLELTEAHGQATVETETDQSGLFSRPLLPGRWYAEFIPPFESDGSNSPESMQIEVAGTQSMGLGDIYLSERVLLEGYVVGPSGEPTANVGINITERGFNDYSYSTTTNGDGFFSVEVPDVAIRVSLQPAVANLAITHYEFSDPNVIPAQLELSEGVLIAGTLATPEGSASYTLIEVRDQEDTLYGATLTDQDGYFEMRVTGQ